MTNSSEDVTLKYWHDSEGYSYYRVNRPATVNNFRIEEFVFDKYWMVDTWTPNGWQHVIAVPKNAARTGPEAVKIAWEVLFS